MSPNQGFLDNPNKLYNNSINIIVGTQSICPLWRAGSGILRAQRPELLSPHGFVLFASVVVVVPLYLELMLIRHGGDFSKRCGTLAQSMPTLEKRTKSWGDRSSGRCALSMPEPALQSEQIDCVPTIIYPKKWNISPLIW